MGVTNGVLNLDIGPLSGRWVGRKKEYLLVEALCISIPNSVDHFISLLQSFVKLDIGDNDVLDYFQ